MKEIGVDVKVKKTASLTKKNISLEIDKKNNSAEKPQIKSSTTKKLFENIWNSFTSPSKKDARQIKFGKELKIKQNSLEKHKRLK